MRKNCIKQQKELQKMVGKVVYIKLISFPLILVLISQRYINFSLHNSIKTHVDDSLNDNHNHNDDMMMANHETPISIALN